MFFATAPFDVLHYGHLLLFQHARKLAGDGSLVVTITADKFVNKGPGRPIFSQNERAAMIRFGAIIDVVDICNAASGIPMIHKYKPRIYLKHAEYMKKDSHGYLRAEANAVKELGGEVQFFSGKKYSSTAIINRLALWREQQAA